MWLCFLHRRLTRIAESIRFCGQRTRSLWKNALHNMLAIIDRSRDGITRLQYQISLDGLR